MPPRPLAWTRLATALLVPALWVAACDGGSEPSGGTSGGDAGRDVGGAVGSGATEDVGADAGLPDAGDSTRADAAGDATDAAGADAAHDAAADSAPSPDAADTGDGADPKPACLFAADCDDGDPCTLDTCGDGVCSHPLLPCDDGDPCTADSCVGGVCGGSLAPPGPACCYEGVLHEASFEAGSTDGFLLVDLAPGGEPPVTWQPHEGRAHAGTASLYLGIPETLTFDNGAPVKASATTKPIALPAGSPVELSFWAWMSVEEGKSWDVLTVAVLSDGKLVPVWAKGYDTPLLQWFRVSVDLSAFANQVVQVVLTFDSVDATINDGEGVYVDDLRLLALCSPPPCPGDAACDDGLACTEDSCVGGACTYAVSPKCCIADADCNDGDACTIDLCDPVGGCGHLAVGNPLCCNTDADCEDANACTTDACAGNECKHTVAPEPGCCLAKKDCDDGDPCTIDSCDAYQCGHVNTCCQSDAECDDNDDVCTVDACVGGACKYQPTGVPGCCEPAPATWTFDFGDEGWVFQNSAAPGQGFQLWSSPPQIKSAPAVLYYGDPSTLDFDFGDTFGTATSPPVELDGPGAIALQLWVWMDTEGGNYYDALTIEVVPEEGKSVTVWEKDYDTIAMGFWNEVAVDLSAWAGKTVSLRLRFETKDSAANGGLGVLVDDMRLTSSCVPVPCSGDKDCNDGITGTSEACEGGQCEYVTP